MFQGKWRATVVDPLGRGRDSVADVAVSGAKELKQTMGLSGSGHWFRSLVENTSDVITILETDGTVRYVSPTIERILGYLPEERMGRSGFELVHPDDLARARSKFAEALRSLGVALTIEVRMRHRGGSCRHVEVTGTNLLDDPNVKGIVLNWRDVTERKEAEEEKSRWARHAALRADVSAALAEGGTLQSILQRCTECIVDHLEAAFARIWTLNEEEKMLELQASAGMYTHLDGPHGRVPVGSFKIGLIAQERLPHLTNDVRNDPRVSDKEWAEREGMAAFAGHPLVVEDRLVGVMAVFARKSLREDTIEALASVADVIAQGIERKRTEEALQKSESSLAAAQRIAHIGNFEYSIEEDEARWSDELYRIFGFAPQQFVPTYKTFLNSVHPDDRDLIRRSVRQALYEENQGGVDYRIVRSDGEIRAVQSYYEVIRNVSDRAVKLIGTVHDITERKRVEEALKESEERYRAVIEQTIEGIYLGAADTKRVLESNAAFRGMLGYTAEELRGMHIHEFVAHDPENIDSVFQSVLDKGHHFIGERKYRRKDGSIVDVETSATMISYNDREVLCTVVRDVTERKKAEEALKESEERFRALTQNSSDIITLLAADGTIRYQSPSIERILGYRPEEMIGDNAFDYVHPDDLGRVEMAFAEGLKDPRRRPSAEYRFRHKNGSWRWLESVGTNLLDDPGLGEYVVNSRDITRRRWTEEALRKSEWRMAEAQRLAHVGSWEWDVRSNTISWSDELYRVFGLGKDVDLSYEVFLETIHPADREFVSGIIQDACENRAPCTFSHRIIRPDGTLRWLHCEAVVTVDDAGSLESLHGMAQDITELRQAEERLEHQAFHDALTNLPNRHLFVDRLKQALRRTTRKKGRQVAVLFMDLDDFKAINDSLGHKIGDLLLTVVAQRLRRCLRPEDTLARFGGDEFVVLIEDVEAPKDAVRVAERIVGALREPFVVEGRELFIRTSIGIASGTSRHKFPEDLLRDADTAMYEAKEERLGYTVFDPTMYERAVRRLELENDIRRAIEADEFVLHYQPIMDLMGGEVRGVEALVRWNHPERGLLDPSEFVPVAEVSGLVVPMGEGVLEEACLRAKGWQEAHPHTRGLVLAVNVSARQLRHPELAKSVERVLRETGLEGSCLSLDITETVYIKTLEGNTAALDELRRLGVGISIDDFGTGYSSLAYLKRLPANTLKVDKTFVAGLGEDLEDTAIVRMVIELAHTLGMKVIAEGVESAAQAELLGEMGCDLAQGFFFSEPLPPEEVPGFLVG